MKLISKVFCFLLTVTFCITGFATTVNAAVGDQFSVPENGWQRYEEQSDQLIYAGNWINDGPSGNYSGSYAKYTSDNTAIIRFKFKGTKIRMLQARRSNRVSSATFTIDGNSETFSQVGANTDKTVCYEKTGLSDTIHDVEIYATDATVGYYLTIDSIDIDASGYLLDPGQYVPDAPTNLQATAGNHEINLSWDVVSGALSYNIKRSTTLGGPYTQIASELTQTTYVDSNVIIGTTYYYIVTAVNENGEGSSSNEASALLTDQSDSEYALLVIILDSGIEKEYDVSIDKVNDFINWYETRSQGSSNSYYFFDKAYNKGPFTKRRDYILYNKIISFEVMEYNLQ